MNEVEGFKPVRIDAVSFAERFKGRRVKFLIGYNKDGSQRVTDATIVGSDNLEGKYYFTVVEAKGDTYYCLPEWLIRSGNDFSR